jgi:transcription elongation factor GreA
VLIKAYNAQARNQAVKPFTALFRLHICYLRVQLDLTEAQLVRIGMNLDVHSVFFFCLMVQVFPKQSTGELGAMATERTYLTADGYRKFEEELGHLRNVRRNEVVARIQESKEINGTLDNTDYEEARNEQAFVEGRILTVETMLKQATIIPNHKLGSSDIVELGSKVTVQLGGSTKHQVFTIVGSAESAPGEGLISNESPIGKALLGKHSGDEVKVEAPSKTQTIKLLKVR